jgi:small multidrug resistance pump
MTQALHKIPLGVTYAIWSAFGIVLITIIGAVRYGESLDIPALAGMAMIVGGVLTINLLSKSVAH